MTIKHRALSQLLLGTIAAIEKMGFEPRVYLAGPMTGIPAYNYPLFDEWDDALALNSKLHIVNPARRGSEDFRADGKTPHSPWSWYLTRAISEAIGCVAAFALPGWNESKGATLELMIMTLLGKGVYFLPHGTRLSRATISLAFLKVWGLGFAVETDHERASNRIASVLRSHTRISEDRLTVILDEIDLALIGEPEKGVQFDEQGKTEVPRATPEQVRTILGAPELKPPTGKTETGRIPADSDLVVVERELSKTIAKLFVDGGIKSLKQYLGSLAAERTLDDYFGDHKLVDADDDPDVETIKVDLGKPGGDLADALTFAMAKSPAFKPRGTLAEAFSIGYDAGADKTPGKPRHDGTLSGPISVSGKPSFVPPDSYHFQIDEAPTESVLAESVLAEADRLVDGDRGSAYGHPFNDFSKTAAIWSAILGIAVTPEEVGLCMIGVKMSREINGHKRDNLVDMAGYAKTIALVIEERARREGTE